MEWNEAQKSRIIEELDHLLNREEFKRKTARGPILRYIVTTNVEGHVPTEDEIYKAVIEPRYRRRPTDEETSNVRTQVSDLRRDLDEYYSRFDRGYSRPIAIFIAKSGYGIIVEFRNQQAVPETISLEPRPPIPGFVAGTYVIVLGEAEWQKIHPSLLKNMPEFLLRATGMARTIVAFRTVNSVLIEFQCDLQGYKRLQLAYESRQMTHFEEFPITLISSAPKFYAELLHRSDPARLLLFTPLLTINSLDRQFDLTIHSVEERSTHRIQFDQEKSFQSYIVPFLQEEGLLEVKLFQYLDGIHWPPFAQLPTNPPNTFFRIEFHVTQPPESLKSKLLKHLPKRRNTEEPPYKDDYGLFLTRTDKGFGEHLLKIHLMYTNIGFRAYHSQQSAEQGVSEQKPRRFDIN
jgi:hypothetical protein